MIIVFDLDDTLYDEIDFVKSGFKEISLYLGDEKYYHYMMKIFEKDGSGKVFDKLISKFDLDIALDKLVQIYRFHSPNISLAKDILELLEFSKQHETALISDGNYIMQKNKFNALGLEKYINFPIFTDFYHTCKPDKKPYEMVMEKFDDDLFIYIADNPKKDFISPLKMGWKSIRYKNKNGIYKNENGKYDFEVEDKKDIIKILKGFV